MLQNVTGPPTRRSLEFGIYRDGDNNLDAIQSAVLGQALRTGIDLKVATQQAATIGGQTTLGGDA